MKSRPPLRLGCVAVCALLATVSAGRAQSLTGLALNGNNFTYNAPDGAVTGIFLKPAGNGPFPAVLVSHGKGGNATAFSLGHAQNLVRWGFVCIGPNYTHANTGSTPEDEGYSPENSRRARRCLDILAATPGVDMTRLAAFSHSMGSFLTIGLSGELPAQFRAVAIAAGGTSGTANTGFAAPATQEAQPIRAPFLMLHGTADTTVAPIQSANLQAILESNAVPNKRLLYQGVNHNIVDPPIKRADAYAITQAWFTRHGVLPANGNTAPTIAAPASSRSHPASPPLRFPSRSATRRRTVRLSPSRRSASTAMSPPRRKAPPIPESCRTADSFSAGPARTARSRSRRAQDSRARLKWPSWCPNPKDSASSAPFRSSR
jgi:dienelactone hydrolase